MKLSMSMTVLGLLITSFLGYEIAGFNTTTGQNMTIPNNMTSSDNMTNATASGAGASAKMHIEEAIKALEAGNTAAASTHLTAAQQAIPIESEQVKMHFGEAMKAFSSGDSNGALMHLKAANDVLG